jgi:hypothetical protein
MLGRHQVVFLILRQNVLKIRDKIISVLIRHDNPRFFLRVIYVNYQLPVIRPCGEIIERLLKRDRRCIDMNEQR